MDGRKEGWKEGRRNKESGGLLDEVRWSVEEGRREEVMFCLLVVSLNHNPP